MKITVSALIVACLFSCKGPATVQNKMDAFNYTSRKHIRVNNGAVVTAHPLASAAGVEVLKKGGNAFDASIAAQFTLAVVYPGAGNLGGGGFMVARRSDGELISLDYRETAPALSHKNMYLDSNGNVVADKSIRGPAASGVPGTVAGIFEILKYAKLSLPELIRSAMQLAENGFSITEKEALSLNSIQNDLINYNSTVTAFHKKDLWKKGDTLIQKDLAATLKRIRDNGREGFYGGQTAKMIADEMYRGGGIVRLDDLLSYKAKWRNPYRFLYRGYEIISMGLPSSGGILLHQMLGMLENMPVNEYAHNSAQAVQLMSEIERRAFADRAEFLGDADYYQVPVEQITTKNYFRERMKDYVKDRAGSSEITKAGVINAKESEETTHISIIDDEGNAVSVTTTLNESYGCRTVVKGAGFFLNNEMDDFSIRPGEPNLYGAIGGEANSIAPGKRMLSSMTPVIVLKNRQPFLIAGTPGGTTIPTSVFQTIVNIIDFELSTEEAVNLPKFHHQWLPDRIDVEQTFPHNTRSELEKMGYSIHERGTIGRMEVIKILPGNHYEAVADKRSDDSAEGW